MNNHWIFHSMHRSQQRQKQKQPSHSLITIGELARPGINKSPSTHLNKPTTCQSTHNKPNHPQPHSIQFYTQRRTRVSTQPTQPRLSHPTPSKKEPIPIYTNSKRFRGPSWGWPTQHTRHNNWPKHRPPDVFAGWKPPAFSKENVFLRIAKNDVEIGVIELKLFDSVVPKTAHNFRQLAMGSKKVQDMPLHFKNTRFYRVCFHSPHLHSPNSPILFFFFFLLLHLNNSFEIPANIILHLTSIHLTSLHIHHIHFIPFAQVIKKFLIQGGDITNNNGTGGASIYGRHFPDESFSIKHDRPFLIGSANRGPNTNNSGFYITSMLIYPYFVFVGTLTCTSLSS